MHSRFANPLDSLLPPIDSEPLPASVGGYVVKGRLWAEPAGEQVWLAEDRALGRRVLLWLMTDDGNPATPLPSEVPRLTRLRRLGRGALHWSNRDLEWVAFAAPVGAPLANTIRKTLAWADARHLLEQLADELQAAEADGSLPSRLDVGQVWVEPNGRLQVLDFPMPGDAETPDCDPFALLRSVASLSLEGTPRHEAKGAGVRAPIPPHAAPIFAKLFSPKGYSRLNELIFDLRETHAHSPEVTPAIRTAHLGIQSALLSFGLILMFGIPLLVGTILVVMAEARGAAAADALKELLDPARHAELRKIQGASSAIENPRARSRIEELQRRLKLEGEQRRAVLFAPQRVLLEAYHATVSEKGKPNEQQQVRVEGEILVWSAANEKTKTGKSDSPWGYPWPFWIAISVVPLMWILVAGGLRGGFSMMLTGIAMVRSDGRRASRRQCALRAAVVWFLPTVLLAACIGVQISYFRLPYLAAGLWLAAAVLMPVYFILALKFPSRPPQDRIAGTQLVPA